MRKIKSVIEKLYIGDERIEGFVKGIAGKQKVY